MSIRIYKYAIGILDEQHIVMPAGSRLLSVQAQRGKPQLWAMVDTDAPTVIREFALCGTGHDATWVAVRGGVYVGTFQMNDDSLVFHLFDLGEAEE